MSESNTQIAEFHSNVSSIEQQIRHFFDESGMELLSETPQNDNKFRIVFVGQYSAGKSSIIKMLTGLDDIAIGAGITTQKNHVYSWNNMEIVDTPGIHTVLHPEHDEIAYKAILTANLIIYVTTNELFDDENGEQFRELAIDKDRAGEMILVVNKMTRTAQGNTPEQQAIIREGLLQYLDKYTPEQVHLCFLDAKSYLDSIELQSIDPELAEISQKESGRDSFVQTLHQVIDSIKDLTSLTKSLNVLLENISCTLEQLENTNTQPIEDNLNLRKHVFTNTKLQLQTDLNNMMDKSIAQMKELGYQSIDLITESIDQEKLERSLEKNETKVNQIIEQCLIQLQQIIEDRFFELNTNLQNIKAPEIDDLKFDIHGKISKKSKWVSRLSSSATFFQQKVTPLITKLTAKEASKLQEFTGTKLRDLVGTVAKKFNVSFKPWEGNKITQKISDGAKFAGNAIGIAAGVLSIVSELKSKRDESLIQKEIKEKRQMIREQFDSKTDEFEQACKDIIQQSKSILDNEIQAIDAEFVDLKAEKGKQSDIIKQLKDYKISCFNLLHEIHLSMR